MNMREVINNLLRVAAILDAILDLTDGITD